MFENYRARLAEHHRVKERIISNLGEDTWKRYRNLRIATKTAKACVPAWLLMGTSIGFLYDKVPPEQSPIPQIGGLEVSAYVLISYGIAMKTTMKVSEWYFEAKDIVKASRNSNFEKLTVEDVVTVPEINLAKNPEDSLEIKTAAVA